MLINRCLRQTTNIRRFVCDKNEIMYNTVKSFTHTIRKNERKRHTESEILLLCMHDHKTQ